MNRIVVFVKEAPVPRCATDNLMSAGLEWDRYL
jgi:hypothetical protein